MTEIDPLITELRRARRRAELSALDVARRTGLNRASIANYETGHCGVPLANLRAYARALGYGLALVPLSAVKAAEAHRGEPYQFTGTGGFSATPEELGLDSTAAPWPLDA